MFAKKKLPKLKWNKLILILLILGAVRFAFGQQSDSTGRIHTTAWKRLVPSDSLPSLIKARKSNNNLDIAKYKGRYYLAFRTAPSHFPSKKVRLYVMSSPDFEQWTYETTFFVKADLREPRFVQYRGRLFLYFFEGAKSNFKFEPRKIWCSYTLGEGQQIWTKKKDTNLDGYVPWRLKVRRDTLYLSAYYGVNLYKYKHQGELRLFVSSNGFDFRPISDSAQVTTKGAEEGEFEFDAEGNLWATVRLEGSGAYIAYANKDSLDTWHTWFSKRKYDSALMFKHKGTFYVISRRNLKGNATEVEHPTRKQRRKNLIRYSFGKKKTALFRLDKQAHKLVHIMDFPSTGDNSFAGIAPIDENSYYLLNYSSDFTKKKEKNWISGQLGKTYIYWAILRFDE